MVVRLLCDEPVESFAGRREDKDDNSVARRKVRQIFVGHEDYRDLRVVSASMNKLKLDMMNYSQGKRTTVNMNANERERVLLSA